MSDSYPSAYAIDLQTLVESQGLYQRVLLVRPPRCQISDHATRQAIEQAWMARGREQMLREAYQPSRSRFIF